MRRNILLLLVFIMFISSITAKVKTRSFDMQGAFGEVVEVDIEPVPAQTQSYIQGMPFNIEDALVQYNTSPDQNGRYIAEWSLIANVDFNIYIRADRLRSVNANSEGNHPELDYVLSFDYDLSYYEPGLADPTQAAGRIKYETSDGTENGADCQYRMYKIIPESTSFVGLVGALNGPVYFQFTKDSTDLINTAKAAGEAGYEILPAGDYTANVYIVIEEDSV